MSVLCKFYFKYLIIPLFALSSLLVLIEFFQLDMRLETYLYTLQGKQWALKNHWLLENVLHTGARMALVTLTLCLLITWILSFKLSFIKIDQGAIGYLLLTAITSVVIVSALKSVTQIDCPWYLQPFGGDLAYFSLYQTRPASYPAVSCFPAGHASAGYAWLGLFYVCKARGNRCSINALIIVLFTGFILGCVQQIRGAHFISHDIWSLAICWTIATIFSPIILNRKLYCIDSAKGAKCEC